MCLAGFLFPFYADEFNTMVVRMRNGENLLSAHRKHIYQLLANEKGIPHWKVSMGYGLRQLLVGVSVLAAKDNGLFLVLSLLVIYFAVFCAAGYALRGGRSGECGPFDACAG